MAVSITKAVIKAAAFGYGIFTVILYGIIALSSGTYFTRRTEKESLELQLGKHLHSFINRQSFEHHRLEFIRNQESLLNCGDL